MADRHKSKPKAVRMPDGLLAWYEQHAGDTSRTVNAVLVGALEDYRQRHEGGSTTAIPAPEAVAPRRQARKVQTATAPEPAESKNCKHPKVRVKGVCPDCQKYVAKK